jgi:hypothetical protein
VRRCEEFLGRSQALQRNHRAAPGRPGPQFAQQHTYLRRRHEPQDAAGISAKGVGLGKC